LAVVGKVPDRQVLQDLSATVEHVRHQSWARTDRVGATGFCWGGRMTWLFAAHEKHLKAAVAWYGPLGPWRGRRDEAHPQAALDVVEQLACPVLGLYGGADEGIPVSTVREMEAALKAHKKTGEFVVYPSAPHGFFADYRPSYRADVAKKAWKRALGWFETHLKS
jgi:carboxymethylenebutenolidase